MPANMNPIFSKVGDIQSGGAILGPTATTAQDGTGAGVASVYQADATNGGFVKAIRFQSAGSPATTVARVFISSVTGTFTPGTSNAVTNTWLVAEITLLTTTLSQTAAAPTYELPLNLPLPPGYRICVSFGTSTGAAGTGYVVTVFGGKY